MATSKVRIEPISVASQAERRNTARSTRRTIMGMSAASVVRPRLLNGSSTWLNIRGGPPCSGVSDFNVYDKNRRLFLFRFSIYTILHYIPENYYPYFIN